MNIFCKIGIHNWSLWTAVYPEKAKNYSHFKVCYECGKTKYKRLRK